VPRASPSNNSRLRTNARARGWNAIDYQVRSDSGGANTRD
jgi:hypothetical protein